MRDEVAAWAQAAGASTTPPLRIDLTGARGPAFVRRLAPDLILPGVSRPGDGRGPVPRLAWAGHSDALELLAAGAPGLVDWRRKHEASPRA